MKRLTAQSALILAVVLLPVAALAIAPPIPLLPENGSKSPLLKPVLTVYCPEDVVELHFQLYKHRDLGMELVAEVITPELGWPAPTGNRLPTPLPEALTPGVYSWTCRVRDEFGWSEFFAPFWSFEVLPAAGVECGGGGVPMPLFPPPGQKSGENRVNLIVTAPSAAEMLHFQVYSPLTAELVAELYTKNGSWLAPIGGIPSSIELECFAPGLYEWSCRALYGSGWGEFFQPNWTFSVESPEEGFAHRPVADGIQAGPAEAQGRLSVAPNPTRVGTATGIGLNLARAARVDAAVYDVTGTLVRTLARGHRFGPGNNALVWDGYDETGGLVGAGTYLLRIHTDDAAEGSVRVARIVRSR